MALLGSIRDSLFVVLGGAALLGALGTGGCIIVEGDADDDTSGDTGNDDSGTDSGDDAESVDETGGGSGGSCSTLYALDGAVDGVESSFDGYQVDTTFYNTSLEEVVLGEIDFELMEQLGLDPEDPEDQDRFKYFFAGFELRNLYVESLDSTYPGGILPKTGRDVSVALFDLSAHDVQPGDTVQVFDASSFEAVRNSGDRDAIATALRELIDQMRSNDQPDAIVTYAPDRSDESIAEVIFISMLSPHARFGASGTASFHSLHAADGTPMETLSYPNQDIGTMSIDFQAEIGGETVTLEASCLETVISG